MELKQTEMQSFDKLRLSEKSAISLGKLEPDYVLNFAVQESCSDQILAATSSNYNIRLYSRKDLANIGSIKGHSDVITGVAFGVTEPSLLYSASQDETTRCWDLRQGLDKEVQTFRGPQDADLKPSCVDIDCTDRLLCAGTEKTGDDTYILFWDRRKGDIMGCYKESHQSDVTQVKFNPSNKDLLASSCDDGLVCIFDVSQTSEDDAILYTFNAECSVSSMGWYGRLHDAVYCLTTIDTFHVWETNEGDEIKKFEKIKESLQDTTTPVDYLVDVLSSNFQRNLLIAGTYEGNLRLVEAVDDENVTVLKNFPDAHRDRIRCSHWDEHLDSLVTGGEDSLLCLWSPHSDDEHSQPTDKRKIKNKRKGKKSQPY